MQYTMAKLIYFNNISYKNWEVLLWEEGTVWKLWPS